MTVTAMLGLFRHLRAAFCAPVLLFVATTTAGLVLATHAGMFGIPLALLLTWSMASYALALIEASAHGRPVPLLSIEMINVAHNQRPLGALVLVGTWAWLVATLADDFGPGPGIAASAAAIVILPAMIALLCVDDSWFSAVSPVHLWRLVRGAGLRYVAFLLLAALYGAIAAWATRLGPPVVGIALGQFVMLSLCLLLGGLVYDRRAELGVEAWISPERTEAKAVTEEHRQRERVIHDMYGLMRANKPQESWERALAWITPRASTPADLLWLRDRIAGWEDRRIADRITRELVTQQLRRGDNQAAIATVQDWLGAGGTYRASHARELGRLVGLARMAGHSDLAERLLADCGAEVAADTEIASLLARRARERSGSAPD